MSRTLTRFRQFGFCWKEKKKHPTRSTMDIDFCLCNQKSKKRTPKESHTNRENIIFKIQEFLFPTKKKKKSKLVVDR